MFIQNKYTRYYYNIVNAAKARVLSPKSVVERHHIIPKSLGGDNSKSNIVNLTSREHFICHKLLMRMTEGVNRRKMTCAAWFMCITRTKRISSRSYALIRSQLIEELSKRRGEEHPNTGRKTGRTSNDFTPEWRRKISEARKGQSSWNKGIPRSDDTKRKMSETRKSRSGTDGWNNRPPCSKEKAEKIRLANSGKKWVHDPKNPSARKQLNPTDCSAYLEIGWVYGYGPRTRLFS